MSATQRHRVGLAMSVLFLLVAEAVKPGIFALAGLSRAPRKRPGVDAG